MLGHIKGSCMTCILRIARISNVEIIMSRGVLIKRVEFREDVRSVRNNDVAGFDFSGNKTCFYLCFRIHRCAFNAIVLQCDYSNRGTWKKIIQSQRFLKTKDSHVFLKWNQ